MFTLLGGSGNSTNLQKELYTNSSISPGYTYMSAGLTYLVYNEAEFSSDKSYTFMNVANQDYVLRIPASLTNVTFEINNAQMEIKAITGSSMVRFTNLHRNPALRAQELGNNVAIGPLFAEVEVTNLGF